MHKWVTLAFRPLRLVKLATAVGIQRSTSLITLEQAVRDAVTICGPFLKVEQNEVSLSYQSAHDYLLRKDPESNDGLEVFRIQPKKAHLDLAQVYFGAIVKGSCQRSNIHVDTASINATAFGSYWWKLCGFRDANQARGRC